MSKAPTADWRTPTVVLVCGGIILTVAMGIRHGFGLFLQPISHDMGWGRETFALAIAVQNLVWGATQPFTGMLADKYGSARVVLGGAALFIVGLFAMAYAHTPWLFVLDVRRADRNRTVRYHLQRRLGRARSPIPAREAQHGARHFRRRRLVRPIRHAAADAVAAVARGLVRRTARHGRHRGIHRPDGGGTG